MDKYKQSFEDVRRLTEKLDFVGGTNDGIVQFYVKLHSLVSLSGLLAIDELIKVIPVPFVRNILGEVHVGVDPMEIIEHAYGLITGSDTPGMDGIPPMRSFLHVLGAVLVQNGDDFLQTKMESFVRDFNNPDLSMDAVAMTRAIRLTRGNLFFPEEEQAHTCLRGSSKDHKEAVDLYSQHPVEDLQGRSLYDLALIHYSYDQNSQENLKLALSYAVRAAEIGHLQAAYTVGNHLIEGIPSFCDDMNGWLEYPDERSVILGYAPYSDTIKTTSDIEKGMAILKMAAEAGHSASAYCLSIQLARTGDMKSAYHWLTLIPVSGTTNASVVLGDFHSGRTAESPFDRLKESGVVPARHEGIETYASGADSFPPIVPRMIETIFESEDPMAYTRHLKKAYAYTIRPTWGKEHRLEFLYNDFPAELIAEDILGVAYLSDIVRIVDLEKARFHLDATYREGRKSGYTVYLLGILQLPGWINSPEDVVMAHKLFMEAADLGCAPAAAIAGRSCLSGERAFLPSELTENPTAAMKEYSIHSLPADESQGLRDTVAAERYLQQAADAGFAAECLTLAEHYEDEGKYEKSRTYRVRAAHLGDYSASLAMAESYCGLDGSQLRNFDLAERYCEIAYLQSTINYPCLRLHSRIEAMESHDIPPEFLHRLLIRAAGNGSKKAVIRLGLSYLEGTTVPQDISKGVEWLLAADGADYADDHKDWTDYDLEAHRAEALAGIYGNHNMAIYDSDEARRFIQIARDIRAEKKQVQDDTDALFDF